MKRNHEKHTMLADVEEEQEQDVICFDDITGKELPWHAVRKARELELKYLRDLGVYEKVDEKEAVEKYGITPVDTKWVDTDKAFEEEPMQIRSRICAREFKSHDRPALYAGKSNGHRRWESGLDEKEHVRNEGRGQQLGT